MNRSSLLLQLRNASTVWDVIVIGGGASGLGIALDAASRGFSTLLVEQADFAQETSSRSTKLVHGGVRYLKQGRISLVREALKERAYLHQNAPHLVHPLPFLLPASNLFSKLFYYIGIKMYDLLAGRYKFGTSQMLSQKQMLEAMPNVSSDKIYGGIRFYDGQFDDSRLAVNLAQSILDHDGIALNYMQVTNFIQDNNKVIGIIARDTETTETYTIKGKSIINATGVFVDQVRRLDNNSASDTIIPSQGAHIVLDRSFYPGADAMIVPETADGRVLFAIPWLGHVLVGTTDVAVNKVTTEPKPLNEEIDFILNGIASYLVKKPTKNDVLTSFAGLRPLIKPKGNWSSTGALSRDYQLSIEPSGLISITGGKWTTYRKMGEDTVNRAIEQAGLPKAPSITKNLPIHGSQPSTTSQSPWSYYGSDEKAVEALADNNSELLVPFDSELSCRPVDVLWAVRHEMARKLEDILCRRTRCLFLDSSRTLAIAPRVVKLLAKELSKSDAWAQSELKSFETLARRYSPEVSS